jgi:hypothetical protein
VQFHAVRGVRGGVRAAVAEWSGRGRGRRRRRRRRREQKQRMGTGISAA